MEKFWKTNLQNSAAGRDPRLFTNAEIDELATAAAADDDAVTVAETEVLFTNSIDLFTAGSSKLVQFSVFHQLSVKKHTKNVIKTPTRNPKIYFFALFKLEALQWTISGSNH